MKEVWRSSEVIRLSTPKWQVQSSNPSVDGKFENPPCVTVNCLSQLVGIRHLLPVSHQHDWQVTWHSCHCTKEHKPVPGGVNL